MAKIRDVKGLGYFSKTNNGYVYKIPIGTYETGNTQYKSFSAKTKKAARERAIKFQEENAELFMKTESPLLETYIMWWAKTYKRDAREVRPQTYTRMCNTIHHQIIPRIGKYRLMELTKTIIQTELVNPLLNEVSPRTGKRLSASSVSKALIHLRDCLNQAVEDEMIQKNPCASIRLPKQIAEERKKEIRFFNDEEINAFCTAASEKTVNGYPVCKFGRALILDLYTGLRIGELINLKKTDIDLEKSLIHVSSASIQYYDQDEDSETYKRSIIVDSYKTKTKNGIRKVPLCPEAKQIIIQLINECDDDNNFLINNSSVPVEYHNIRRTYRNICQKAGIEDACGVHTLRHTCASLMLRRGVDVKVIAQILGHGSAQFTYDTYIHITEEQIEDAAKKLDFFSHKAEEEQNAEEQKKREQIELLLKKMSNEDLQKILDSMEK